MRPKIRFIHTTVYAAVLVTTAAVLGACDDQGMSLEQRDCVAILGDSIFALSGAESRFLEDLTGQEYRQFFRNGAQLSGGIIPSVETQLARALRGGPVRTLILDGGGNDALIGGLSGDALAAEISAAFTRILDTAQMNGVENMIVQGYYRTSSAPADFGAGQVALGQSLEAGGLARGINLAFVDPNQDPFFTEQSPSAYTIADGIHPTDPASRRLAELVFDAMVANDIEQGPGCPTGR